jgi:hypothetical protein
MTMPNPATYDEAATHGATLDQWIEFATKAGEVVGAVGDVLGRGKGTGPEDISWESTGPKVEGTTGTPRGPVAGMAAARKAKEEESRGMMIAAGAGLLLVAIVGTGAVIAIIATKKRRA